MTWTPTTEQVRDGYRFDPEDEYRDPIGAPMRAIEAGRAFDRWLAAHDAELREQIAAEIEDDPKRTFLAGRAEASLTSHELAIWSGMRRAARIARGETS